MSATNTFYELLKTGLPLHPNVERTASQSTMQVQLAPSIEHQSAAMLSILERYKWHQFSIVTSQIAGHDDFVQAVRERVNDVQVSDVNRPGNTI